MIETAAGKIAPSIGMIVLAIKDAAEVLTAVPTIKKLAEDVCCIGLLRTVFPALEATGILNGRDACLRVWMRLNDAAVPALCQECV